MKYQVEFFEEENAEEFSQSLNSFLLLLPAERVKKISCDEKLVYAQTGAEKRLFIAAVVYTYED